MRHRTIFERASTIIGRVETSILAGIILFSALLLFSNVLLRYVFLKPIFWAEELSRYLMVWMIFLGAGRVVSGEGHISVTLLVDRISPKCQRAWNVIVTVLCFGFCAVLFWTSLSHTLRVMQSHQVTAALEMPMWLVYLSVTAGAASMMLRYGISLIFTLKPGQRE